MDATDVRGLLSLLLVDGSLVPYRCPAGGYIQLTLTAGSQAAAFLEEKVAEFRQFLPTEARIVHYTTTPRANGKVTPAMRFRVSTHRLKPVYNLLYPRGQRQITSTALAMLGARAAAWTWAQSAKTSKDGEVELSRVGRSEAEAHLVAEWLEMLTGASSEVGWLRKRPSLLFAATEAAKIHAALGDYAPLSRRHLFSSRTWDVSTIRSLRTELLLGAGQHQPAGAKASAVA